jgi:hypothetical protein
MSKAGAKPKSRPVVHDESVRADLDAEIKEKGRN